MDGQDNNHQQQRDYILDLETQESREAVYEVESPDSSFPGSGREKSGSSMQFELPEAGIKALEDLGRMTLFEGVWDPSKDGEEEDESGPRGKQVDSVDDMTRILNMQAAKTFKEPPRKPGNLAQAQPPGPPASQSPPAQPGVAAAEGKPGSTTPPPPAKTQGKMIIGLSGSYIGAAPPQQPQQAQQRKKRREEKPPTGFEDLLEFLEESIEQYGVYVNNIGRNGLAAANLGYYRDDIQEMLDLMKYEEKVNLRPYWERILRLDMLLQAKAPAYVREVGYQNFKQYQIINDPPHTHWWWYLNRRVAPPVSEVKFWEIWK